MFLPASRGHVVGTGVSKYMAERVLDGDIARGPADDDGKLRLVIHFGSMLARDRKPDSGARIGDRRPRFHEHDRA